MDATQIPTYRSGKRSGPGPLMFSNNEERDLLLADQDNLNMVWILSRQHSIPKHIPSWTGFHMEARNNIAVLKTSLGYLDCLDAPASDI